LHIEVVRNGHFDIKAAEQELFPVEANLTETEKLAKEINDTHFYFSDDAELNDLIAKI